MWKQAAGPYTLVNAVVAATTGTAHQAPGSRVYDKIRYYVISTGSTTATVDIEGSPDGTNYAKLITQIANPGTAKTTGVIDGPVKYIRAVTAGATHGTITVKIVPVLEP